jgi:hypothetical protein
MDATLETNQPEVLLEEDASVLIGLEEGVVSFDETGTKILTVQAKALDEGVWNGLYFKPEDIEKNISKLNGKRVLVSHTYEKPDDVMGWVENVDNDGTATLRIFDSSAISGIEDGTFNSVSVGVMVQQTNGIASILDFNEISLTGNPACATCVISSYSESTLEKEETNMTNEEEIVEETAELCECDEEAPEAPEVLIESDFQKHDEVLEMENKNLRAELEAVKKNVEVLRQHKEALELERRSAHMTEKVEELCANGAFKPANSDDLHSLLMTFSEEQMKLFDAASKGFGAVVLEEDLGEVEYIPPHAAAEVDLENDLKEFRTLMGYKNKKQ